MGKFKYVAIMFIILFFFAGGYILMIGMDAVKEAKAVTFEAIDWSAVEDGRHEGSYRIGPVYARVAVTVAMGEMKDIELLEHETGWGEKAEAIISDIVRLQRVDVDAVSGATVSSRTIEKAVEQALMPQSVN